MVDGFVRVSGYSSSDLKKARKKGSDSVFNGSEIKKYGGSTDDGSSWYNSYNLKDAPFALGIDTSNRGEGSRDKVTVLVCLEDSAGELYQLFTRGGSYKSKVQNSMGQNKTVIKPPKNDKTGHLPAGIRVSYPNGVAALAMVPKGYNLVAKIWGGDGGSGGYYLTMFVTRLVSLDDDPLNVIPEDADVDPIEEEVAVYRYLDVDGGHTLYIDFAIRLIGQVLDPYSDDPHLYRIAEVDRSKQMSHTEIENALLEKARLWFENHPDQLPDDEEVEASRPDPRDLTPDTSGWRSELTVIGSYQLDTVEKKYILNPGDRRSRSSGGDDDGKIIANAYDCDENSTESQIKEILIERTKKYFADTYFPAVAYENVQFILSENRQWTETV